jgi:hypothetical protein
MQCVSDKKHCLALRSKPKHRILEECLSDVRIDGTQWIIEELLISFTCRVDSR